MQLSVVIVNYNVRYFLEQALLSVFASGKDIDMEVFVVDNNSQDSSVEMVREKFPRVKLIVNRDNPGFSKANNQAIALAEGKYVLILNPDTVLEENTLGECIRFMENHADCGAIGVRMIDGAGNYLEESKRGLPTPWVSFCKITGLNALFPESGFFNRYYMGHLSDTEVQEVEILSGAFMFMRKEVLDKIGYFDEAFFMYGEDVDLSYRVMLGGYKNYYLPTTRIIHYKGESTKKSSINYVRSFHNAMIIFSNKHFASRNNKLFSLLIKSGVYIKAVQSVVSRILSRILLPLIEFVLIWLSVSGIAYLWSVFYYKDNNYFTEWTYLRILPVYSAIYIFCLIYLGSYDSIFRKSRQIGAVFTAFIIIAFAYSFLPNDWRSSRFVVFASLFSSFIAISLSRSFLHLLRYGKFSLVGDQSRVSVVVGSEGEYRRIQRMLQELGVTGEIKGRVGVEKSDSGDTLGHVDDLQDICRSQGIDQIIFCGKDMRSDQIILLMTQMSNKVEFKIAPEYAESIIGSKSKDSAGELYTIEVSYRIDDPMNRRLKRAFDFVSGLILLLASPLLIWFFARKKGLLDNVLSVLRGDKTWVGYYPDRNNDILPKLKPAVFYVGKSAESILKGYVERENFLYARDYSVLTDIYVFLSSFGRSDRV